MSAQTVMPPEVPAQKLGPCAWCGESAVDELQIQKPKYTQHYNPVTGKRVKQMVKRAITAPVCDHHLRNLKLNERNS